MMGTIVKTRLMIRDQNELLNQIAGTYRDFFRSAMEYVDNAIDAATIIRQRGESIIPVLKIQIDTFTKKVIFTDNCGGMSPQELCELLSEVGRSKKKAVPWANGQFGFGVHAFRAFAREATFISWKKGHQEARIKIDRTFDENIDIPCETTDGRQLEEHGTKVTISRFDPQVFKKSIFLKALVSEIEHHFDDVLRAGFIKIIVTVDHSNPYQCNHFDFSSHAGIQLQRNIPIQIGDMIKGIIVDLKILEHVQDNYLPVLVNKQRRIQTIADLKSYKTFLRNAGEIGYVWSNPFVVGFIEINDLCSPTLIRDDIKDSPEREVLYRNILLIQKELQSIVDDSMNKKEQESFKKLGDVMSNCLSSILRGFKLKFEQTVPTGQPGEYEKRLEEGDDDVLFGGEGPGGGGPGTHNEGSGGTPSMQGKSGIGEGDSGGGKGPIRKSSGPGISGGQVATTPGPRIEFQNHAGEDRIIDLGNSLIVNTQHPDFIHRNRSKSGKIKLDARLLNYISLIIAPPCVHRLFERKGKIPTALEVGKNIIDLSMLLEQELIGTVLGEEIDKAV